MEDGHRLKQYFAFCQNTMDEQMKTNVNTNWMFKEFGRKDLEYFGNGLYIHLRMRIHNFFSAIK